MPLFRDMTREEQLRVEFGFFLKIDAINTAIGKLQSKINESGLSKEERLELETKISEYESRRDSLRQTLEVVKNSGQSVMPPTESQLQQMRVNVEAIFNINEQNRTVGALIDTIAALVNTAGTVIASHSVLAMGVKPSKIERHKVSRDTPSAQRFVLLPARGLRAAAPNTINLFSSLSHALTSSPGKVLKVPNAPKAKMRVIDSIGKDKAKLVEMSPDALPAIRAQYPGVRLVPLVYYRPAVAPRFIPSQKPKAQSVGAGLKIELKFVSKVNGGPVIGAYVAAFTDFANRVGHDGTTNNKGVVRLSLGAGNVKLERLYVYPTNGFWSLLKKNLTIASGMEVALNPLDLAFTDSLRHFYGNSSDDAGQGIKVAVIDTGVDTGHPDLNVNGGVNTVIGENPSDFGDNGLSHGTHVAGIIAARGMPPDRLRGLAPAVILRSYRVFGQGIEEASNYAISKAIDFAVTDGCDLINMSLGGGTPDDATRAAIADAWSQGSLVIVSAGNDNRSPVNFPASLPLSIAISAMGRKGTFPKDSAETGDVAKPYGNDRKNFVATFSNIGREVDLIGPGVGILSTVQGGYAPMSGTSMSCPAVTGLAAKLLSTRADITGMSRDQSRSDAMAQAILQAAKSLGFEPKYEGQGILR